MRRNLAVKAFIAISVVAGAAQAQTYTPPITQNNPTAVPGVEAGGTQAPANEATLTAYAEITSTLEFDVDDSTIECDVVSVSAAGTCPDDAELTVRSNAPWAITMTDDGGSSASNLVSLDNDEAPLRNGAFEINLTATAANSSTDATTAQNPSATDTVTIAGAWTVDTATSASAVDPTDEYGTYQGTFTVVLFEQ